MVDTRLSGFVLDNKGAAVSTATIAIFDRNTTTPEIGTAPTVDGNGFWSVGVTAQNDGTDKFDVQITNGAEIRRLKYDDEVQLLTLETAQFRIRNPADTFVYDIVPKAIVSQDQTLNLPLLAGGTAGTIIVTPSIEDLNMGGFDIDNATLASPVITTGDINTPDIDGGTVDAITSLTVANNIDVGSYTVRASGFLADGLTSGLVVYTGTNGVLSSEAALAYNASTNTLTAGNIAGTLSTAAQASVTSLGTLTALTVDNVAINGTTIGHTSDTDLLTLASGIVTVAGEVSMTTLDIGGTNVTSTAAELNIVDGVTSTAAELNLVDGSSANSVVNSRAVIYGSSGELAGTLSTAAQGSVTSLGTLSSLTMGGAINMVNNVINNIGNADTDWTAGRLTIGVDDGTLPSTINVGSGLIVKNNGSTSDEARLVVIAGNVAVAAIDFGDAEAVDDGRINYSHSGRAFQFYTANTFALVIDSSQRTHIHASGTGDTDLEVSDGATLGNGTCHAAAYNAHSMRELKSDIVYLSDAVKQRAYDDVKGLRLAEFRMKREEYDDEGVLLRRVDNPSAPLRRGPIFEDAPESIKADHGTIAHVDRINNLEMAVQQLITKIEAAGVVL